MQREDAIIMRVLEIQDENRKNPPVPAPAAQVQAGGEAVRQDAANTEEKQPTINQDLENASIKEKLPIIQPVPVTPTNDQKPGEPAKH